MSNLNRPTEPDRPYDPRHPVEPAPQVPYDTAPAAYDPQGDVTAAPTNDPRLGLDAGRYWGGAFATIIVAALIGVVAWFVVERVADQELHDPPFGGDAMSWAIAGALFALVAAVLLHLFVATTPKPASFFGWVVALATVILAAIQFTGGDVGLSEVLTAVVWLVLGVAVWSLLTGVLSRTLVHRGRTL